MVAQATASATPKPLSVPLPLLPTSVFEADLCFSDYYQHCPLIWTPGLLSQWPRVCIFGTYPQAPSP